MKTIKSEEEDGVFMRSSSVNRNRRVFVGLSQIDENDYGEEKLMHSHSNPVLFVN